MHRFRHGLVIGRFLPVHAGHEQVLDEACRRCARLSVAVLDAPGDGIPAATRAGWLRELRPDVDVVEVPVRRGREPTATDLGALLGGSTPPIDAVVGGRVHDRALAEALRVAYVDLPAARRTVPITSGDIRVAPGAYWPHLPPAVRAWYVDRIVVVGAEASGSGRLSGALADALRCGLVPDTGRTYAETRPPRRPWRGEEFRTIAERQQQLDQAVARATPNRWLVCNADPLSIAVWHLRCTGHPAAADALAPSDVEPTRPPRLYVLTAPDFTVPNGGPFGGPVAREEMHRLFRRELAAAGVPWLEVGGPVSRRLTAVLERLPELRLPSLSGVDPERLDPP